MEESGGKWKVEEWVFKVSGEKRRRWELVRGTER